MGESIFDAACRAVAVEDLAGKRVKLKRAGRELRGACPLCGAGEKSKNPPFAVKPDKGAWRCYGCEAHGDVVDLERALNGGSGYEAAQRLVGGGWRASADGVARARPKATTSRDEPSVSDRIAAEMWATARPAAGTLVEAYLAHRLIAPDVIAAALPNLRFHPFAKWAWDDEAKAWVRAPAMVVQVRTEGGPTGGVHATYLAPGGKGKAALNPAKRMWGPQRDAQGRPGGAWLIGPEGPGRELVAGEGIETGLSVATLVGRPVRVCAALSLRRLQGILLRDQDGCADLEHPQPDPEGPAFTWTPPADAPWAEVWLAIDHDMSPVKLRGRTGRGKPVMFELDAPARARLCARLAKPAWAATGVARVRAITPPLGRDFNDELKARRAGAPA